MTIKELNTRIRSLKEDHPDGYFSIGFSAGQLVILTEWLQDLESKEIADRQNQRD